MDAPDPPAIRAAGMLEPLQVHAERGVELSYGCREHHGAPPGVFLDDREAVGAGKFLDRCHIGVVGAKLLLEFVTREMAACPTAPCVRRDPLLQRIGIATA